MTCPRCHAETSAGMRFCGKCAAPLIVSCERCGTDNPAENKFCGHCGAPLYGSAHSDAEALSRLAAGELKRVSVLFCDIVDSTSLTERLGAEAMHELIRWFLGVGLAEVHRYEGSTPQFTGDGFLALFGAPITHEDHVRRALLAAVAIQAAVNGGTSGATIHHPFELRIRIGIHTGLVVFGSVAGNLRMDPTAIGDAANIAARLQAAADPGTILISEETRRLAQGYARVEPVGLLALKGKGEPMAGYRLLGVSHRSTPDEVPAARPFVDRTSEIGVLTNLVRPAREGRGRVMGIVGEPGIGKSRLVDEFRRCVGGAIAWVEGRCLSYGTMVPYLLVLDLLRSICGIADADSPEASVEKLHATLKEVGMDPDQDSPLLLHLLGIRELGGTSALSSPEAVKAKAFETLRRLFIGASGRRPLALALEDLHWLDKVSEEFLGFLAEAVAGTRILLLATYRPGYRPPWVDKSYAGQVPLEALSQADSLAVLRSVPGRLDAPVTDAIVAKADGNPFFLEQLALDAGEARVPRSAGMVPDTIHDVVMARIDRLPDETKRLLQTASVIGREFSLRLLREVWRGAGPIESLLRELVRLEFIDEQSDSERTRYVFRHALTQETAYSSLLERYRRALHAVVGKAIEKLYEERTDEVAEQLAFQFGRSDEAEQAVDYAILAGEKAQRRWANGEAVAYFDDALRRLGTMPDSEPNRLRRIDAVLKPAEVKFALGRHRDHIDALEGIRDIIREVGDPRRRATWHYWTGFLGSLTGNPLSDAIEHCLEAAKIASANALDDIEAFATSSLALVYIVAGKPSNAIEAGERALSIFEAKGNFWWAGRTLWHLTLAANALGQWDASLDYCSRALEHGTALNDLRLKAVGWWRMGSAHIQRGDFERGLQCCAEALALAPIPYDVANARAVRGYGLIKAGQLDTGIAELAEAVAWFESFHLRQPSLRWTLWLAEGYLRRGDHASALPLIDDVLNTSRAAGYRHLEGLACLLMGDCLGDTAPASAEDYAKTAIGILEEVGARNDLAKGIVVRARLRQAVGDLVVAQKLLEHALTIFEALGTGHEAAEVKASLVTLEGSTPPVINKL